MRLNSNTLAYFANEIKAFRNDLLNKNKGIEIEEEPEMYSPFGDDDEIRICAIVYDVKEDECYKVFRDYTIKGEQITPDYNGISFELC